MLRNSLLFIFCFIYSQDYTYNGYLKMMPYYNSTLSEFTSTFTFRLNNQFNFSDNISIHVENKFSGLFSKNSSLLNSFPNSSDAIDINSTLIDNHSMNLNHRFDRLYMEYWIADLQLIIGRQRISWGKNLIWNPTDIFHPTSPIDFDNEEKNGADAIYSKYYINDVSSVEYALKKIDLNNSQTHALKVSTFLLNFDVSVLYGFRKDSQYKSLHFAGFSWSGEIAKAGFRGEIMRMSHSDGNGNIPKYTYFSSDENPIIQSYSIDYTFENSLYLHTEFLSNTHLYESLFLYYNIPFITSMITLNNWSMYNGVSYQIHPLIRIGVFNIYEFDRKTNSINISVNYSLSETFDLSSFILITNQNDVIKSYQSIFFLRGKWYF